MSFISKKGFIFEKISELDWLFGADNGIKKVKIENIAKYLPTTESQRFASGDYWMCVPFSICNCIETYLNYLIKNFLISEENFYWLQEKGYLDENGKINFDDWFVARNAGTKPGVGTSFSGGAHAVRHYGLTPQSKSPFPKCNYYDNIPQELFDLGEEFLKRFKINYEIVYERNFIDALDYGPIQVGVSNWLYKNGVYVNNGSIIHSSMLFDKFPFLDFDTYSPFIKQLASNYNFMSYGYQWYISEQTNSIIDKIMDFWVRLRNGAIYWGKAGTKKIQKVTKENAGLIAITHLMRKKNENIINLSSEEDSDFKDYEVTEEFVGADVATNLNWLTKLFSKNV